MRQQTKTTPSGAQETATPAAIPAATGATATSRPVRIIAGADVEDMAIAGRTVGDARRIVQGMFSVHAEARALLDGQEVGDDQVLGGGQMLEFVKYSGQKGTGLGRRRRPASEAQGGVIRLEGERAIWQRDQESVALDMPIVELVGRLAQVASGPDTWRLHPRNVRLQVARGPLTAMVIEMEPGPRQVRWISEDSEVPFGDDARYEVHRLSFPFVLLFLVFADGQLTGMQQAFYRRQPLRSLDDSLHFTNLLNVAEGYGQESWVCLVNMDRRGLRRLDWPERVEAVTDHFWHAAFSRSSEVHEGNSHWGTHRGIDRRLASAEAWERATEKDPYFTLEIDWPRAPRTVGGTIEHMLDMAAPWRPIARVEQLATLMQKGA